MPRAGVETGWTAKGLGRVVGFMVPAVTLAVTGACRDNTGGPAAAAGGSPSTNGGAATSPPSTPGPGASSGGSPASSGTDATTSGTGLGITCFTGPSQAFIAPSVPQLPSPFLGQGVSNFGPPTNLAKAPPAISGGTLLVLPGDLTAVAADPDRDQIYVVDLTSLQLTFAIPLQAGDEPGRVIADGAGRVHVALRGGGALVTLDPASGTILQRRPVCAAPRGLAYDARTDLVHVACASGELVSFPSAAGAAVRHLQLDSDLRDVVVQGDLLRVSRFRAAEILTLDASGAVSARTRPGTFRAATARGGQSFTPAVAWRMVGTRDGGVAMVHQRGVDDPIQRGQPGQVVPGSYGGGSSSRTRTCDGIVHSAISRMKPDGSMSIGPALPDLPLPVDMAVSPDGQAVAMVAAGNDGSISSVMFPGVPIGPHVSNLDLASGGTSETCLPDAGLADCWGTTPLGVRFCGSGKTMSGQFIAVAFSSSGALILQSREPASLNVGGHVIGLSADSRNDTGHTLFHMNAGAGLACASCHSEGLDDGRVWNFTCTGGRRTQSLQTGLRGTAPFHWDGDERSFSQLATDVFTGRMSGPELNDQQSDTILTWLDAQPRVKVAPPADALALAAVERGRAVFNRPIDGTSCASCHSGPQLTNAKTVDVGTGGPLQVPSLVGLADHAPYMHTGCAATLIDRFAPACGGGDQHGKTSGLAAADLADLVSYLQTL